MSREEHLAILMQSLLVYKQHWNYAEAHLYEAARQKIKPDDYSDYDSIPEAFALTVLKQKPTKEQHESGQLSGWWSKQVEVVQALLTHRRVLVKAGHGVGKTQLAGGLVNWFFDCFNPGITLTTAPTQAQVMDLLWKQVRSQRHGRPGLMPKAARLEHSPDEPHYAVGYTARDAESFQGRHEQRLLIIFDECVGVESAFWDAADGMVTSDKCRMLCLCNPTDTTSRAYAEEQSGRWHVVTISCLDHPNIAAELEGREPPYPSAVRLAYVEDALKQWAKLIAREEAQPTDVEFPPGKGKWYRPGPLFECKVLGRWPSTTEGVWSEALWQACLVRQPLAGAVEIGCDVARFGEDFTAIHVRQGNCSMHHERHNGWSTSEVAGRLKQLCQEWGQRGGVRPQQVAVKVDDDGVGGGVVDQKGDYRFLPVGAGCKANKTEKYRNRRNELWFDVTERANQGLLDLSRLDTATLALLKRQAMAPRWRLDAAGKREVERKDETKKKIGCSPDDMDALNLAYAEVHSGWENYQQEYARHEDLPLGMKITSW